jgi:hypothetical protein
MRVLPGSALSGLNAKQIAALGRKPGRKQAPAGPAATPAKSHSPQANDQEAAPYRLHTPKLLPDSVRMDLARGVITLKLGGVPENFSNARYGKAVYQKKHSNPWSRLVRTLADQARVQAHLPRQEQKHAKRRVEIMIFRCAPMFDPDAISHTMKPVVDALKKVLIYDDSHTYLKLKVDQTRIFSRLDQYTRIVVRDLPASGA